MRHVPFKPTLQRERIMKKRRSHSPSRPSKPEEKSLEVQQKEVERELSRKLHPVTRHDLTRELEFIASAKCHGVISFN